MNKNKMLFKNRTKYTKQNYKKFINFHANKFGLKYDIFTIIVSLLFIYCLVEVIKHKVLSLIIIFIVSILIFVLYRFLEPINLIKKQTKSKTISEEHEILFYFYEKHFKIREKANFSKIKYWQLHKVYETDKFFYLYLTKKNAFLVDKTSFTLGESEEFSNFIKKKVKFKYKLEQ